MITSINLKIVFAHLTSRVKQVLVAMLSVTFGISMYIFMNSFITGVNDIQTELAFSTLPHVSIYNDVPEDNSNILAANMPKQDVAINLRNARVIQYTEGIKNSAAIMNLLENQAEIAEVTPQVNINVFFRNGATRVNGTLSGIDVVHEDKLFKTSKYLEEGNWNELQHQREGIIMGIGLARKLSLRMNDNVQVQTGDGVSKNYKVIGILRTTLAAVDNNKGYIRINEARQLISENQNYVTNIQINIKDYNSAEAVAEKFTPLVPYKVESWQEANGQLDASNKLRNIIAYAVSLTILLVAGFGIYNIMNMTVNEKIKEIAILKAMGFDGNDIIQIFLAQSIVIGICGGVVGMLLGYSISVAVNHVPFEIATLKTLPITYRVQDYTMAFIFGLITTFIAGYLPAKKASKVDPVEIIRG